MEKEKSLLIDGVKKHKEMLKKLLEAPTFLFMNNAKTVKSSTEARKKGNDLFVQGAHNDDVHREIFNQYCISIAMAPNKSEELAFAYGNRSAFLLHLQRYQDCIKDVDKALKISTSSIFKVKMLCRKVECLKKLGSPDCNKVLKEAKTCESKIKKNLQEKQQAKDFIEKVENLPIDTKGQATKQSTGCEKSIISLPTTDDPFEFVDIKYNEQFGRHLVAAKDYKPGDIIFVEDLYAMIVNPNFPSMLCSYCLNIAWSGIPCEHCNWAMFCSDDCRSKAWKAFHDVECSLISAMRMDIHSLVDLDFCVRLLVRAMKEANGSISKLKKLLKEVDDCTDVCFKGFMRDEQFITNTIQCVYSLKSDVMYPIEEHGFSVGGPPLLFQLVRHTNLLGAFDPTKVKHLLNEDLIFLGALTIKFSMIRKHNCLAFSNETRYCKESKCMNDCRTNSCCAKGTCMAPLISLINNSCYPNACKIITADRKVIVYAQRSIKRNSQIFISNLEHHASTTLPYREAVFTLFQFNCSCKACNQSWPSEILSFDELYQKVEISKEDNESSKYFYECKDTLKKIKGGIGEEDDVEKLSKILKKALKNLKEPSDFIDLLDATLTKLFSLLYGLNPFSFGQCEKMLR